MRPQDTAMAGGDPMDNGDLTRDEIRDVEIAVGKLVDSEQPNWRIMERLLMASLEQGTQLQRARRELSKLKRQRNLYRDTLNGIGANIKNMNLNDD